MFRPLGFSLIVLGLFTLSMLLSAQRVLRHDAQRFVTPASLSNSDNSNWESPSL